MGKDQEFLEAARNGNISLIEKILNQKAKRSGPLASLRRGPGINIQDNGGYSALHYSALNGHTDIVRLLLIHEASPNILDSRGSSPLHLAAWAGHQEIVKMLLTHPYKPANPDMQTMENETPLHCAAQHGHTGALTTLLAHGADPNVCNSRNETPLDLAAQYGRLQAVQLLIRAHPELLQPYSVQSHSYSSSSRPTVVSHSALHLASRNGHNNIVEILLSAGVNVNLLTPSGTALHEAALCGKDLVVRTLLEAGADLSATDSEGRTPFDVLQEFPPHVTKGIISVINSFRTRFDDDLDERCSFGKSDRTSEQKSNGTGSESAESWSKDTPSKCQLISNNDVLGISPSVSINSFEQSMASSAAAMLPKGRASNDHFTEFYVPMAPIRMQRSAPKKPPRRNLSISPTHIQNFFPISDMARSANETRHLEPESSIHNAQKQGSYEYMYAARTGSAIYSSKEDLIHSHKANNPWYLEMASPTTDVKPVPAPRKLKNQSSISYEASMLRSYNPNRKLKRNRENYFAKGQFSLTISSDSNLPWPKDDEAAINNHFKRPLSQEYACTADYLQQNLSVDSGNSPQDHPLCVSLCNSSGSISSGVSLSDRSVSTDCVEEYIGDEPFAGLFKGSTMNLNNENNFYAANDYHQCGGGAGGTLRTRNSSVEKKTVPNIDSESSEEALNIGTTSRKNYKREERRRPCDESRSKFNPLSEIERSSSSGAAADEPHPRVKTKPAASSGGIKILGSYNENEAWQKLTEIMETFGNSNGLNSYLDSDETYLSEDHKNLARQLDQNGLRHLERTLFMNGYDSYRFINGIFEETDLSIMHISGTHAKKLVAFIKMLPYANFSPLAIESSLDQWLKSIQLTEYSDNFKKHLYNTLKSVCGVWEIELQTVLEINKIGHRKRILHSVAKIRQAMEVNKSPDNAGNTKCESTATNSKGTLRNKKNRPAPRPPLSSLEIRAPTELLIGLPSSLHMKWPHSASSLISHFLRYEVYYLGSTVVKELRGTESTRKSIQKLKRVGRSSSHGKRSLVQLSISYRGVGFIDVEKNGTICEHEIRNINCACQDADDMTHFAYITKDSELNNHYCHVFNVDSMRLAMEIILTLAESFEVAYQMALRNTSKPNNRTTDSTKAN